MASPTASTPPTVARPRGVARREALLEAALQIAAQVGADAVTHRRVAEVAGLPLASTTYWFDSKEDLLTAALKLAADRDLARLRALDEQLRAAAVTGDDAIEGVIGAVTDPLDEPSRRASTMATFTLMLEAARRPQLQELSRRWTAAYVEVIGALLRRAGSTAAEDDAMLVLAAADGLALEHLATGEDSDHRVALRRLIAALVSR